MKKIKELSKDPKLILMGILLIMLTALIIFGSNFKENKIFEIEDKCGKFVNLMSHTINDEGECKTRCRSQCISQDYKYGKVEFEKSNVGCNSCTCFCK